jgi:hypothetical protein
LKRFNQDLITLEDHAITYLLASISGKRHNPQMILQELVTYELIIKRSRIIMSLDTEKDIIQKALFDYLEKLRERIITKKTALERSTENIRFVEDIIWSTLQAQKVFCSHSLRHLNL